MGDMELWRKSNRGLENKVWFGKRMVLFGGVCGIMRKEKIALSLANCANKYDKKVKFFYKSCKI